MKTRRPAFTLLELLISAALFATVAVMVVGILATSTAVQDAGQRSQGTSAQLQRTLDTVQTALTRSAQPITINTDSAGKNKVVVFQSCLPTDDCSTGVTLQRYEVYCVNSVSGTDKDRLLQYILPASATFIGGSLNSVNSCNPSSLSTFFSAPGTLNYLTDTTISVPTFNVQGVQNAAVAGNADAYEVELAGAYKGAQGTEVRANTLAATPIFLRTTAVVTALPALANISQ